MINDVPDGLHLQLEQDFLGKIRSGDWKLNQSIPTERELMTNYRASRSAVRRALKMLEDRGLLEAVQGSGRRVVGEVGPVKYKMGLLVRGAEIFSGQAGRVFNQLLRSVHEKQHDLVTFSLGGFQEGSTHDIGESFLAADGLFVIALQYQVEDIRRLALHRPVVAINHDIPAIGVPSFSPDYDFHAGLAVRDLVRKGHQKIGLIHCSSPFHAWITAEMRRGWELGHLFADQKADPSLTFSTTLTREGGREVYRQLRQHPEVTAVITYGSDPISGMAEAAREEGRNLLDHLDVYLVNDVSNVSGLPAGVWYAPCSYEQMSLDAVDVMLTLLSRRSALPGAETDGIGELRRLYRSDKFISYPSGGIS